jgi:hypothetical protein
VVISQIGQSAPADVVNAAKSIARSSPWPFKGSLVDAQLRVEGVIDTPPVYGEISSP